MVEIEKGKTPSASLSKFEEIIVKTKESPSPSAAKICEANAPAIQLPTFIVALKSFATGGKTLMFVTNSLKPSICSVETEAAMSEIFCTTGSVYLNIMASSIAC